MRKDARLKDQKIHDILGICDRENFSFIEGKKPTPEKRKTQQIREKPKNTILLFSCPKLFS